MIGRTEELLLLLVANRPNEAYVYAAARALNRSLGATATMLLRLEDKGLLTSHRVGRRKYYMLTEAGMAALLDADAQRARLKTEAA